MCVSHICQQHCYSHIPGSFVFWHITNTDRRTLDAKLPPAHAEILGATVRFMTPRYEYRVWATDLTELAGRLTMHCTPLGVRASDETYVVHPRADLNIKIRSETLDIKQLVGIQQGFQLWTPILKEAFPLSASSAAGAMEYFAEMKLSADRTVPLDVDGFLAAADNAGAVVATVAKLRHGFVLEECILEFAEVTIDGFSAHTVAVESEDLGTAATVASRLGIDRLSNQSYPQEIRLALQL